MADNSTKIYVYADWMEKGPVFMGEVSAIRAKGRKAFSYEFDPGWVNRKPIVKTDPDIEYFLGNQFPKDGKECFGFLLDSMPDTWGRKIIQRKVTQEAKEKGEKPPILYEIDYLLKVFDKSRMGAIRYKLDKNGDFLDNSSENPTPPWSSLRELQHASKIIESGEESHEINKWLSVLLAPGSSLGGARPKANVVDETGQLWIAKFPSNNDTIDKGAWEYLAYKLALDAGIDMSESIIEKISGEHHTFLTKRFDREGENRIHFASAMTMTGNSEELLRYRTASYLEIADYISHSTINVDNNLEQLWRRIVFNIFVSNTDDHLRNHGFLLNKKGWLLSPAYDINPSIEKDHLALNIDLDDSSLDIDLAISVGEYFRLNENQMESIIEHVKSSVSKWRSFAKYIGIKSTEQDMMQGAFNITI